MTISKQCVHCLVFLDDWKIRIPNSIGFVKAAFSLILCTQKMSEKLKLSKYVQKRSKKGLKRSKKAKNRSKKFKKFKKFQKMSINLFGWFGLFWTFRDFIGPLGTYLGPFGTFWDFFRKIEFLERICDFLTVCILCSLEWSVVIYHKNVLWTFLDFLAFFYL